MGRGSGFAATVTLPRQPQRPQALRASPNFEASRDRRHGDPFPLPFVHSNGIDRFTHKHAVGSDDLTLPNFECSLTRLVNEGVWSLNALATATLQDDTHQQPSTRVLPLTAVQKWMINDISERVLANGPCPTTLDAANVTKDALSGALSQYELMPRHLANFDLNLIKILRRKLVPTDARTLCPPAAQEYLRHYDTH